AGEFLHVREQRVHPVQAGLSAGAQARQICAQQNVVFDAEVGEQLPAHGHVRQAAFGHLMRLQSGDVFAVEHDPPLPGPDHARDGAQDGRLTTAVAAYQADQLVLTDDERYAEYHLQRAITQVDILDRQYDVFIDHVLSVRAQVGFDDVLVMDDIGGRAFRD